MPVISNTSPLLNLAIIGELHLLRQQADSILIPLAVEQELRLDSDLPGAEELRASIADGWVQVQTVNNRSFAQVLRRELDAGEAEAIVLAVEREASLLLLDEREGRRVARSLGLNVTGVLGILLRARREGQLTSLRTALHQLRTEAGFWIAPALEEELLQAAGEQQS